MRAQAIENIAVKLARAVLDNEQEAALQLAAKLQIVTDRKRNDASVIREALNSLGSSS